MDVCFVLNVSDVLLRQSVTPTIPHLFKKHSKKHAFLPTKKTIAILKTGASGVSWTRAGLVWLQRLIQSPPSSRRARLPPAGDYDAPYPRSAEPTDLPFKTRTSLSRMTCKPRELLRSRGFRFSSPSNRRWIIESMFNLSGSAIFFIFWRSRAVKTLVFRVAP